jgi:hypothetical protein
MTRQGKVTLAALLCLGVLGWSSRAEAVLCTLDAKADGTGLAMRWPKMPIQYVINASKVAAAEKAAAIKAVQDAFATYEKVTCTTLKFEYKGESTSVSTVTDMILVNFSDVSTGGAYYYGANVKTYDPPDIKEAIIQMNIKDYKYVVGAQANAIDIQTAVTQMIPVAIGFYAAGGTPPKPGGGGGDLPEIKYNVVVTTLTKEQEDGVRFTYPSTATGCSKPAVPTMCAKISPPAGDGTKPTGDGGVKPTGDGGVKPTTDGGTTPVADKGNVPVSETGVPIGGDPSPLPPPEEDGGCCRVGHTGSDLGNAFFGLLGLLVLGALVFRARARSRR